MKKRGQGDSETGRPRPVPVAPSETPKAPDLPDPARATDGESGWGRDPAVPRSKKAHRRITLELGGPPLALPGEGAARSEGRSAGSSGAWPALDPGSALLALPPEMAERPLEEATERAVRRDETGPRSVRGDATASDRWSMHEVSAPSGFAAALAVDGLRGTVIVQQ